MCRTLRALDARRAALAGVLAAVLGCAAPALAEPATPAVSQSQSQSRSQSETERPVLPGQQADQDLRQSMTTPTPEERWRGLPLFGRDLFLGESAQAPVENGPVGPDYVLGPGDNLLVFVSAWSDTTYSLTLDREGQVFLPRIGTTSLWGLSFADADRLIRARLSTVLRNARVQVSMGRMRALEVFVLGSVRKPGKVTLAGSATVLNALVAAGGPDTLGSLRDIRVLRADHEVARLDLYPFLTAGDRHQDVRLQTGDVVFVSLTRARVGIQGDVVRPGVYESPGPISLRELLRLAGGPTPLADLERVSVERVDANGGFRLQDVPPDHGHGMDPDSLLLSNLDLVTVLPLVGRMRNLVTLDGFVRHPGQYELAQGMKLSDLVRGDRLLPEADLTHAEFRRVDLHDFKTEVRAFSPTRVLAGQEDWPLQPLDAVTVFSSARLPWTVTLQGEVTRPGLYTVTPGERLSDLLDRAGGVTPRGSLRAAVFRRRSAARDQRTFTHELEERQRIELLRQQMSLLATGDTVQAAAAGRVESELVDRLGQQSELGRVVLELDSGGKWRKSTRDPVIEDGDEFNVPVAPATVAVLGNVMNPGTLIARRNSDARDYVRRAGGLAREADLGKSYLVRASGEAESYRAGSRVEPGDAIVVVPRSREPGVGRSLAGGTRFLLEMAVSASVIIAALK